MRKLEELREEIDNVDREIVKLFERRMEIVLEVAKYKTDNNLPILNISREEEVIKQNTKYLKNADLSNYLREFYINLMNLSKNYQNRI